MQEVPEVDVVQDHAEVTSSFSGEVPVYPNLHYQKKTIIKVREQLRDD